MPHSKTRQGLYPAILLSASHATPLTAFLSLLRLEKKLLGNVTYYTDYCVTHEDTDYMSKM